MNEETKQNNSSEKKSSAVKSVAEFVIVIILAVIVAVIINNFVISATRVHGISMNNTLYGGDNGQQSAENSFFNTIFFGRNDNPYYGDKVVILKTQKAKKGDIVIFKAFNEHGMPIYDYDNSDKPTQEQWIKRVIGVGGDEIKIADGLVYVNGELLNEPYINRQNSTYMPNGETLTVTVKEGEIFVMGDNREYSTDSRRVGCIKTENIVGRVILVFGKKSQTIKTPKRLSNLQLIFA